MDDDWQDDLWDYTQDGDFNEDEYHDGDEDEKSDYEETFEDDKAGSDEEIEFAPDYKQLQQISDKRTPGGDVTGPSKGLQKAQRTPEEATLDQVEGVLSSTYPDISSTLRHRVINVIEKVKNVYLYNVDILVLAAIWTVEGKELTKQNIKTFTTRYKTSNTIDLIRYIRVLLME